jgi:hypothetical protein
MARYVVNGDWSPQVASALTPALTNSPTSTMWGWANIKGSPGTTPIPSPKPGVHSISPSPQNQPSHCSPDIFFPSLYQSVPDIGWRHVPVRPQEIMPVPATNLYNMPGLAMRSRKTGGRHQVAQPSVVQSWPDLLGRMVAGASGGGAGPLPPKGA